MAVIQKLNRQLMANIKFIIICLYLNIFTYLFQVTPVFAQSDTCRFFFIEKITLNVKSMAEYYVPCRVVTLEGETIESVTSIYSIYYEIKKERKDKDHDKIIDYLNKKLFLYDTIHLSIEKDSLRFKGFLIEENPEIYNIYNKGFINSILLSCFNEKREVRSPYHKDKSTCTLAKLLFRHSYFFYQDDESGIFIYEEFNCPF